jgi:hypothetical protein
MVNPIPIENFRHAVRRCSTLEIIFFHHFPIVSWETPVLAQHGKTVGRCTCLPIQVKERRLCPGFNAIGANPDRYVALECNALLMTKINRILKLFIQMILNEIMYRNVFEMLSSGIDKFLNFLASYTAIRPLPKICVLYRSRRKKMLHNLRANNCWL